LARPERIDLDALNIYPGQVIRLAPAQPHVDVERDARDEFFPVLGRVVVAW
jgi:hypothetical protein